MAQENVNPPASEQSKKAQPRQEAPAGQQEQKGEARPSPSRQVTGQQPGGLQRREPYQPLGGLWRASPFSLVRRMMEDMDRMMEELIPGRLGPAVGGELQRVLGGEAMRVPPVEVFERDGHLVVHADLPGMTKDNIRVELTDDSLVIEGERRQAIEEEGRGGIYRSELSYGSFRRAIPLPEDVNKENVQARFDNGVLEIMLPFAQERPRARRVEIQEGKQPPGSQCLYATPPPARPDPGGWAPSPPPRRLGRARGPPASPGSHRPS
jgi:HSP20 family protein